MKILTYPSDAGEKRVEKVTSRGVGYSPEDEKNVAAYLEDVGKRGDEAVVEYTRRFDSEAVTLDTLKVTTEEFDQAVASVDSEFLGALERATDQITDFHRQQKEKSWMDTPRRGVMVGQLVHPVDAAGIYAPGARGGNTPLVSSVLMGGIPAQVAGVPKITLMTPPRSDGTINPCMLAAARQVGIDTVFKAGSAWAIAAMAYGTAQIPRSDVIVGPGNIYVTLAKKLVSGTVGIDMIAGPSEILIIADRYAQPNFLAADLLSQAEHDEMASAILITDHPELAQEVARAVDRQLQSLDRQEIARSAMDRFGTALVTPDLDTAFDLANRLAPEHLELAIERPFEHLDRIRNAGAIFIGPHTPEPVGDYIAGPNHVLPTAGTARFSSALSVDHFTRKSSLIHYSETALAREAGDIITLARTEGLDAHANAVKLRLSSH